MDHRKEYESSVHNTTSTNSTNNNGDSNSECEKGPSANDNYVKKARNIVKFQDYRDFYQLEKLPPAGTKKVVEQNQFKLNLHQQFNKVLDDGENGESTDYILSKGLYSSVYKCLYKEPIASTPTNSEFTVVTTKKGKKKSLKYFAAKITCYCFKNVVEEKINFFKSKEMSMGKIAKTSSIKSKMIVESSLNEIFLLDEIRREKVRRGRANIFIIEMVDSFIHDGEITTIMEFAPGGDLQSLLDQDQVLYERDVKRYMKQLLTALDFLHSFLGIAHLDIKPQNLLLMGEFPLCDIKLCDFELSRRLSSWSGGDSDENPELQELMENLGLLYNSSSSSNNSLDKDIDNVFLDDDQNTSGEISNKELNGKNKPSKKKSKKNKQPKNLREIVGTPDYVAPEILEFNGPLTPKSDIWSTGVTMYVLLTGFSPFGGDTDLQTFQNILSQEVDFPRELFSAFTSSTLSIPAHSASSERDRKVQKRDGQYKNLSAMNLNEYEDSEEIISNECIEVIAQFLAKDPGKRPMAHEALEKLQWFKQKSYVNPNSNFNKSCLLGRSKEKLNLKIATSTASNKEKCKSTSSISNKFEFPQLTPPPPSWLSKCRNFKNPGEISQIQLKREIFENPNSNLVQNPSLGQGQGQGQSEGQSIGQIIGQNFQNLQNLNRKDVLSRKISIDSLEDYCPTTTAGVDKPDEVFEPTVEPAVKIDTNTLAVVDCDKDKDKIEKIDKNEEKVDILVHQEICKPLNKPKTMDKIEKPTTTNLSIFERRRNTVMNLKSQNSKDENSSSNPQRRNSSMTLSEVMAKARKEANIKTGGPGPRGQRPGSTGSAFGSSSRRNTLVSNACQMPKSPTVKSTPQNQSQSGTNNTNNSTGKKFEDQNKLKKRKI